MLFDFVDLEGVSFNSMGLNQRVIDQWLATLGGADSAVL